MRLDYFQLLGVGRTASQAEIKLSLQVGLAMLSASPLVRFFTALGGGPSTAARHDLYRVLLDRAFRRAFVEYLDAERGALV